jgi:hypothetical protein
MADLSCPGKGEDEVVVVVAQSPVFRLEQEEYRHLPNIHSHAGDPVAD